MALGTTCDVLVCFLDCFALSPSSYGRLSRTRSRDLIATGNCFIGPWSLLPSLPLVKLKMTVYRLICDHASHLVLVKQRPDVQYMKIYRIAPKGLYRWSSQVFTAPSRHAIQLSIGQFTMTATPQVRHVGAPNLIFNTPESCITKPADVIST